MPTYPFRKTSTSCTLSLGDDYLIHYMLDIEAEDSILDLDQFKSPFRVQTENHRKQHNAGKRQPTFCETFQYLIGLKAQQQSAIQYFHAKPDENGPYEGAVTLVPDVGGEYAFRKISGTLPDAEVP